MKVILTQHVQKVGKKFEVVEVSDGYGQNYLIPRGLAKQATPSALRDAEKYRNALEADMKHDEEALIKSLGALDGTVVTLTAKANEKGHLFAGIDAERIQQALKEVLGISLAVSALGLKSPLKEVGENTLTAHSAKKNAQFTVIITPEA